MHSISFSLLASLLLTIAFGLNLTAADKGPEVIVTVPLSVGSFEAKSNKVEGMGTEDKDHYQAESFSVSVDSLSTEIDLRDEHLRKRLESTKYPKIVVSKVTAKDSKGTAEITIKNITKSIHFEFKDLGNNFAEANFELNLQDFNISDVKYMGIGVEDKITIMARVPYKSSK